MSRHTPRFDTLVSRASYPYRRKHRPIFLPWSILVAFVLALLPLAALPHAASARTAPDGGRTYTNPLDVQVPGDGKNTDCPDPSIIHGQTPGDTGWYIYCTSGPLNGDDRDSNGNLIIHRIKMLSSQDLVHWTYRGDVFPTRPTWLTSDNTWAPDIRYFNNTYYLYYTGPDTTLGGSAIFVVTSTTPLGPWHGTGTPVVEPEPPPNGCCPTAKRWTFDSALITDDRGQTYIFYGSYFGGISARKLSADGLHSDPASQVEIAIPNRYEGSYLVKYDGYYYLFASATNCCNGPLTGYSVFVGRSRNVLGPYLDREGNSFLAGRVGGTPVISMNGNRWVGPGHNAVFTDMAGQDWFLYHAVDRTDPYFPGTTLTRRPVLMDPLDWDASGWPTVRGGYWASDTAQPAPAAQRGEKDAYVPVFAQPDTPGQEIASLSDEFNGTGLSAQWRWIDNGSTPVYNVSGGSFNFEVQKGKDLYESSNNASVLTEPTPSGDYVVDTKVHLNLPPEGCCHNYTQAGLVIYGDNDNFIKLAHVSIWETRQTEFAKEIPDAPRYGNTVVGPPSDDTYLRIVKTTSASGEELYRAYTSQDGVHWVRGGVWTHHLGSAARIGLVSMAGDVNDPATYTASFDYVRVYALASSGPPPTTATPELGSGELLATGLVPVLVLLYRRHRSRKTDAA